MLEWGSIASWWAAGIATLLMADRIWSFIGRAKYATRDELLGEIDLVKDAHHRIDLVEERMKGMPGYAKFEEIDDRVGKLLEGQAARREWEKGVEGQLARIYDELVANRRGVAS